MKTRYLKTLLTSVIVSFLLGGCGYAEPNFDANIIADKLIFIGLQDKSKEDILSLTDKLDLNIIQNLLDQATRYEHQYGYNGITEKENIKVISRDIIQGKTSILIETWYTEYNIFKHKSKTSVLIEFNSKGDITDVKAYNLCTVRIISA